MLRMLLLCSLLSGGAGHPVTRMWTGPAAGIPVRVISVNLSDPRVKVTVQMARGMPHGAESMSTLVARTHPVVAINGAYASERTLAPIGDMVVCGKLVYAGMMGTVLAIRNDNSVVIRRVRRGRHEDWSEFETVVGCGPALVLDGKMDVTPREEGFGDPAIMVPTRRMGVGVTSDNRMLFVMTGAPASWHQWARVMLALNCRDAINMDAGASLGMYYRGKAVLRPNRYITNIMAVFVDRGLPEYALLVPPGRSYTAAHYARGPADPGNAAGPGTIRVKLCAESMQAASPWCPVTVERKVVRSRRFGPCPIHHAPAGETQASLAPARPDSSAGY